MEDRKQQSIVSEIKALGNDIIEVKGSQPLGGASFVNYVTQQPGSYDYTYTQNVFKRSFRVTFTHALPGKYHILNLSAFFRLNNADVMGTPYLVNVNRVAQLDVIPEPPARGLNRWLITTENFDQPFPGVTYDFYWKLIFHGTTTGTFTITPVWP